MVNYQKVGTFGAVAGLVTPYLMKYAVMPVLDFLGGVVPAVSLKLSTINVNVRESLTGIEGGMSGWLVDSLGLTFNVPFQTYIMGAIGGALLFILGAWLANTLGFLKGNDVGKTRATIFWGSLLAGFILGGFAVPEIGIDLVNALIAMLVNAAILAYVFVWIVKAVWPKLIPY